jgi:hypothetical protein
MTNDEFSEVVRRLELWAEHHLHELQEGNFLVERDPQELEDRRRAAEYCRRNGLPLPALLLDRV